jgi:hypothetical protein
MSSWSEACDIPQSGTGVVHNPVFEDGKAEGYLYNAGDADLMLEMKIIKNDTSALSLEMQCRIPNNETQFFGIENLPHNANLKGIMVDFFRGTIYGLDNEFKNNGNTYFTYMTGNYIYIPKKTVGYYSIESDNNITVEFIPHYLYI